MAAVTVFAAGCGRSGSSGELNSEDTQATRTASAAAGDFGTLKDVCGPGDAKTASAQGVTASEINVGVFSDVGFTKNSEFDDAAKVFTSWCNDAGGINGRKISYNLRDTAMLETRQRMIESCREDFAIVGGGAALDAGGVEERLKCLLPDIPAQTSMVENIGSDLQIDAIGAGHSYARYGGYYKWLITEAHPESAGSVGVIAGDSPVTKTIGAQTAEALQTVGGTLTYNDLYPAIGVSDWTPYAQAIKSKGVRGLVFLGDFRSLAKLEQVLKSMDYKLDWIDANSNAYGSAFQELGGDAVTFQTNYADLSGVAPLEAMDDIPALEQVEELYKEYAPKAEITFPALRAFSAWLLFASSASECGDDLTRKCLYETARAQTDWTAGGLQAEVDISEVDAPLKCFNVVQAKADGWELADFKPDTDDIFRCDAPEIKYTGDFGSPLTLASVGKSMNDLQ
ncbi:ABC transporter substrate-binding protein [Frankia sp. EI5c]|uniref:ABC transporter substrate-binding protein n=1 Tax=Frankia sp. EI5c TaxID=683316 RepID=UPI0008241E71|nr:ABC transporter substrate-binding protein [Frankia sp. EI5c]